METNQTANAIELQHVRKEFGEDVVAVQDFNVEIRRGEFFTLLGPSGCGKTTTLRMIAGLERTTSGSILLEGVEVAGVPAHKRNVNTVFQDYAIFPHLTVKKNIYFPLRMKGVSLRDAEERIERVLRLVNLTGFERRLPQQLSGGQRQRVALARSLINEPAALLLDEPLGALDFKLRVAMQHVLKDIQRNVGITFVYVTHDQTEALTMSDRIAVMKDGYVHQIDAPDQVYNNPASAYVASFIGDMNFLHGRLQPTNGASSSIALEGTDKISARAVNGSLDRDAEVIACIRTERVLVNSLHPGDNVLRGELSRIVFRGTDYEATCRIGNSEIRSVVSSAEWDHSLQEGQVVNLSFNSQDVIVFPRAQERDVVKYTTDAV